MRPFSVRSRGRQRAVAAAVVGTTVLGLLGLAALPATADTASARTVQSGQARFEVLSPTLIRTEYAGDSRFTDGSTFNVIGRDDFAPTTFTKTERDGWLTLDTGSMTVRYKEGSGAFTQDTLQTSLTLPSGQQVSGTPWVSTPTPSCAIGSLCEAEALRLTGLSLATDHAGFTGAGFAAGFESVGNAMTFTTTAATAGSYDLALRYANSQGGDGKVATRTLSVTVDGGAATTVSLAPGANWDDWKTTAATAIDLPAGTHTVRIERAAGDSGQVNVDSLALVTTGGAYPAPTTTVAGQDCAFGAVCQAEDATLTAPATAATNHNGSAGAGFVAGFERAGAAMTTHVTGVPAAGDYTLQVRYANGGTATPTLTAAPTGQAATTATLPPTSGWDYWNTVQVPVHLAAGANDVVLGCPTVAANCNVNFDTVAAVDSASPVLAAHAPLGGYRRDLDTANGSVKTNPGLLYQDGWSLLDDSASAGYDQATDSVTPASDHGGKQYQDGYVFGYGNDYRHALQELAVLTGPTKLLPRWAYGVWYSEYYDRSQADYLAIAKQFKEQGVPVDVMAIDTDYKVGSPTNEGDSKWDGWSVDPARIPDMTSLLADWHAQGIHNTLNIHPSISSKDPEFAAAQATAKGKLTKGDGDRYLFDWSDPDQLKAYFDLHTSLQPEGVDMWWLDWCCSENSKYSANGVTPDAFINQQYAKYTDEQLKGRGLAFSRAYGSLTAGGYGNPQAVPTGPWADKRTTVHFTGDTTSSWDELAAQVGYTPGESAATGLSAISHDIGGHNGAQYGIEGKEPGTTQLPADMYARWVQFGAFQPIDRLHSNHSDRLPWQYPAEANASAKQFLNLREDLLPLTYTLAADASATGTPMLQPLYLQYPEAQESYAQAGSEYLYGKDVLVAPVTTANDDTGKATRSVWFPAGDSWTDWFTGTTYQGGTTADVTTDLTTMPVFVRSGGIVPTRSHHVANDAAPLDAVTVTVATGADGTFALHEDSGEGQPTAAASSARAAGNSASTTMRFTQQADGGTLDIAPADGSFTGQVRDRSWTATFTDADRPASVTIDGAPVAASGWTYDADSRTITVPVAERSVTDRTIVRYSRVAAAVPSLQVESPTVTAGDTQTVSGSGFPAEATVTLSTTPALGGEVTVRTGADGTFRSDLAVPATASGRVTVSASVGGVVLARVGFTVTAAATAPPTASPSPAPGSPAPGTPAPGTGGGTGGNGGAGTGDAGAQPGGGQPAGGQPGGTAPDRYVALAWTGANVVPIGIVALVLLAAGGLLLAQRRRRHGRAE